VTFGLAVSSTQNTNTWLYTGVGETKLKQGSEIRTGGDLVYVDVSPAVRAVKNGLMLIPEGIED
jgi:hypothetical protein